MDALFRAIYDRFTATPPNSFYTALLGVIDPASGATGGKLFYDYVPQNVVAPFAILLPVSGVAEDTFNADISRLLLQVSIYSAKESSSECWNACAAARTFFEDQIFTGTGINPVKFIRQTDFLPQREEFVWVAHGEYRAWVQLS